MLALGSRSARAEGELPPWTDTNDVPLAAWARAASAQRFEVPIFFGPGRAFARRGTAATGARFPLFGVRRGGGCSGRWVLVGPLAWICTDDVELTGEAPLRLPYAATTTGLPYAYHFAARDGAPAFSSLDDAPDGTPERELEPGFGVAVVEEQTSDGDRYARTRRGRWIALRDLVPARPFAFRGEALSGTRDIAWVVRDPAQVYAGPSSRDKKVGARPRFQVVFPREEKAEKAAAFVRVSEDGKEPAEWLLARDLARVHVAAPPAEVGAGERWVDVDLASQTLVAYEGERAVFATLVSTGRPGRETATRTGVHRVWVKLLTSNMDNLQRDDVDRHYSIEDVPWVQYFDGAIALHAAFWHRDFGHVHSHGCVNLAAMDAEWLFAFTAPHMPAGWSAVFPSGLERGTVVRVR